MNEVKTKKGLRYASVCSGVEAASLAWMPLGWEAAWFAEVEPFPSAVLQQRLGATRPLVPLAVEEGIDDDDKRMRQWWYNTIQRMPEGGTIPNFGDMTKIHYDQERNVTYADGTDVVVPGKIDLLVGGTPCFAAGTMILTPDGYVPIENIKVGDKVINADMEEDVVAAIGNKQANIGNFKVYGRNAIRCTGNHPFLVQSVKRDHRRNSETYGKLINVGEARYTPAEDAVGKYCLRASRPNGESMVPGNDTEIEDRILMRIAGWYVGDGYIRRWEGKNKKQVVLALVCKKKIDCFKSCVEDGVNYFICKDGKVVISNTRLADWLVRNFGEYSGEKRIPFWMYGNRFLRDFSDYYEKADGYTAKGGAVKVTTTSKALAYGYADLFPWSSVQYHTPEKTKIIEGRTVNQRPYYVVSRGQEANPRFRLVNGKLSTIARSFEDNGTIGTVYNITVERKHTYIAEGLCVHNCQSFSVAGKREGLEGASGLSLHFCRLLFEMHPRFFVWENVPGALSSKASGFYEFNFLLKAFAECGYPSVHWRVLDAQYTRVDGYPYAIPQRRRRVFVVGCTDPANDDTEKILFEQDRLLGNHPPRREKGKAVACGFGKGFAFAGRGIDGCDNQPHGSNADAGANGGSSAGILSDTIRIRGGKPGGGKGALVSHEASLTLAAAGNDQTVVSRIDNDAKFWDGRDVAGTVTCTSDWQREPDLGRLQCVVHEEDATVFKADSGKNHDTAMITGGHDASPSDFTNLVCEKIKNE